MQYNPATVIYLKDPELKSWLKAEAGRSNTSFSEYVSKILNDYHQSKTQTRLKNNPLIKYMGSLKEVLSEKEIAEWDKTLEENKADKKSKNDDYYINLIS